MPTLEEEIGAEFVPRLIIYDERYGAVNTRRKRFPVPHHNKIKVLADTVSKNQMDLQQLHIQPLVFSNQRDFMKWKGQCCFAIVTTLCPAQPEKWGSELGLSRFGTTSADALRYFGEILRQVERNSRICDTASQSCKTHNVNPQLLCPECQSKGMFRICAMTAKWIIEPQLLNTPDAILINVMCSAIHVQRIQLYEWGAVRCVCSILSMWPDVLIAKDCIALPHHAMRCPEINCDERCQRGGTSTNTSLAMLRAMHLHTCVACKKREKRPGKFKCCTRCKRDHVRTRFHFCSKKCAKDYWPMHKHFHAAMYLEIGKVFNTIIRN